MEINIAKVLYLFLRLSPFIVVCYFTLMSIFNQDIKGLIYLSGLMFTCILAFGIGNINGDQMPTPGSMKMECKITSLGENDASLSKAPLGILTLAYTYSYLIYIISTYNMVNKNIPILVIFPLLIITEIMFQMKYECTTNIYIPISLILGAFCGAMWALLVDSTGYTDLQLFNGVSTKQVCDRPSATKYRCRIVKR